MVLNTCILSSLTTTCFKTQKLSSYSSNRAAIQQVFKTDINFTIIYMNVKQHSNFTDTN